MRASPATFPPSHLSSTAVGNVHEDPAGAGFPWVPPAVKNINSGTCAQNSRHAVASAPCSPAAPSPSPSFALPLPDDVIRPINTQACVCVMAEACDKPFQQQLLATLEPLCLDPSNKVKCVRTITFRE